MVQVFLASAHLKERVYNISYILNAIISFINGTTDTESISNVMGDRPKSVILDESYSNQSSEERRNDLF